MKYYKINFYNICYNKYLKIKNQLIRKISCKLLHKKLLDILIILITLIQNKNTKNMR